MIITVEIEIEENDWKDAIACGWNKQYDDELTREDISVLGDHDDFQRAVPHILSSCIQSVKVKH